MQSLYICYHGQEDRSLFVKPLYDRLVQLGMHPFYDQESVEWGQPTQDSIQKGLSRCTAALVVVSQSLLTAKDLPMDLGALLEKAQYHNIRIYPLLVGNVNKEEYRKRMPFLHSLQPLCVPAGAVGIDQAAQQLQGLCLHSVQPCTNESTSGTHASCQSNLPLLSPGFIGRDRQVADIAKRLLSDPQCRLLVLQGMPGVGKSLVAIAVAKVLDANGWRIIYVDVRELTLQETAAEKIIEVLGDTANKQGGITGLISAVRKLELCPKDTLLVLDNCDGLLPVDCTSTVTDEEAKPRLRRVTPLCGLLDTIFQHRQNLKAIITHSRKSHFSRLPSTSHEVLPLSTENAAIYLRQKCRLQVSEDKNDWTVKLAELCGVFPTALTLISAIVENNILSPRQLISHLHKKGVSKCGEMLACRMVQEQRIEDCFSEAFEYLQPEELKMNAASITVFPQMFSLPADLSSAQERSQQMRRNARLPHGTRTKN